MASATDQELLSLVNAIVDADRAVIAATAQYRADSANLEVLHAESLALRDNLNAAERQLVDARAALNTAMAEKAQAPA